MGKDKKKKLVKFSPAMERQIALVERYYDVDRATRTITLKLHYEKTSDLLDKRISEPKCPVFQADVVASVKEIIDAFPEGFQVNLQFCIDDYEGYDPKVLVQSFNDRMEFNHLCAGKVSRGNWFKAILLVLAGLLCMVFNIYAKQQGWYDAGMTSSAFDLIFSTFATLFIWEAGTVVFLAPSEYRVLGLKLLAKISRLSFADGKEHKVLASENRLDLMLSLRKFNKVDTYGRFILIVSSFVLAVDSLSSISTVVTTLTNIPANMSVQGIVTLIASIIGITWRVLMVIAGFQFFLEKGHLRKAILVFASIDLVACIAMIVLAIQSTDFSISSSAGTIIRYFISSLSSIGYGVGYLICLFNKVAKKKKEKNPTKNAQ